MGGTPAPPSPQRQFSPDGTWWWDGAQWRPAISPDGRWRWDGRAWVAATPMGPTRGGGGAGMAVLVTVLVFGGVLVLVTFMTLVILLTMGNQIANVFSNVVAALGS
jgi:hypothetical protein